MSKTIEKKNIDKQKYYFFWTKVKAHLVRALSVLYTHSYLT
jgi:hypothetical protein